MAPFRHKAKAVVRWYPSKQVSLDGEGVALSDEALADWGITKEDSLPRCVDVQDDFLLISLVPCNLALASE